MSFQRRASAFDLGRRMDARFMARAGGGPPPFSYDDIPNQLLRINSLEGSLAFSGAVLTGVTDVSPAGETVTVTGSPVYTASDVGLNGAPSFTAINGSAKIVAPNVNQANIAFMAIVAYRPNATAGYYLVDGVADTFDWNIANDDMALPGGLISNIAGFAAVQRLRIIIPRDGSTQCLVNGATIGTAPATPQTGTGVTVASSRTITFSGIRPAFLMLCSSVPSAPLIADLEAKLITDFG